MGCAVDGCERGGKIVRGWCQLHYKRWRKHGDPLAGMRYGPEHHKWKGDAVKYGAIHARLVALFGKASEHACVCGKRAEHWAFDEPWGYSTDLSRYRPLCIPCHLKADGAHNDAERKAARRSA